MQESIGSYRILERIASGGQGSVYRAWDDRSGHVVALKVMHLDFAKNATAVERFRREAQMAASIDHPNIVRVFEVGEEQGQHFMALEYLPISLNDLLQAQGRLPIDRVVDTARQIAMGLEASHGKGIVHRDIKPQNILISSDGAPKITDFGISHASDLTGTGAVMGMPHYMSPEQTEGGLVDIRSDIYSYGVMRYQMITAKCPSRPTRRSRSCARI